MEIKGLAKTTLLDYPGHVAATLFVGGCQFKCPFCHNGSLVTKAGQLPNIPLEEVYSFLEKRRGVLDGVKLDTNGYDPGQLDQIFKEGLVDYVAMDIKNSQSKYAKTVGRTDFDITRIKLSADLIRESGLDYEFRTTIVRELHSIDDMVEIAEWLKGCQAYYLQSYVASEDVIMPVFSSYSKLELQAIQAMMQDYIPKVFLRGIE